MSSQMWTALQLAVFVGLGLSFFANGVPGINTDMEEGRAVPVVLDDNRFVVIFVTVPNKEAGATLSTGLLTGRLAACVNVVPGVESHYWWEDKIVVDQEQLLMIKTRKSAVSEVTTYVKKHHPYTVPEVIALDISSGNADYIAWIGANVPTARAHQHETERAGREEK